ncbi:BTN1 [Coprinopsis cinerea okayama7|uniref:Protein BTN n=1 Tax=Coprinopsis cinerea (strain Okayama-7 / 130 / ATCC MYA-4618 / FGSC 9003) TaxID=240176 RepID=A8P0F2_COPC7|nr:BTN1 [Coprinopsis cinerea okayama7\|eukprot:XP_001837877.1 BTN1 [Coprinopsis cinerea okayama7\
MPRQTTFSTPAPPGRRELFINVESSSPTSEGFDRHDAPRTATGLMEVREQKLMSKLGFSFFLFGLINNVLYVIILSAALDLVPPQTPKGIIAFCNITPSLIAKVAWPYLLKGRIQYARRLVGCCILSCLGMLVVAIFEGLYPRLLGICFASFSSGLGELTFLQLSTTYSPPYVAGHAVGYFASGTGAAGLVGAFLWWEVRGLGVRLGVGMSAVMPIIIPLTYFFLLPHSSAFLHAITPTIYDEAFSPAPALSALPYTPVALDDEDGEEEGTHAPGPNKSIHLTINDKIRLVKPLLLKYMLPLFAVYLFEYTINQGVSPTLLYNIPDPEKHWFLSKVITSLRDYYPLWQLVYQTFVFFSRSTISLGIPALPARFLALPSIVQGILFVTLTYEAAVGFFPPQEDETRSITFVFLLICLEGICGGLAYVNVFYHINHEPPEPSTRNNDIELTRQEREFKIGSIGFSDSTGILLASILAVPTEIQLCKAQVARGRMLCKSL